MAASSGRVLCCGCVLYPAAVPLLPVSTPSSDIHLPVALDVTVQQRLQTVRSAWPAELLCQLTCHGQSQTLPPPVSQLVATAQHPQSLPSPPQLALHQFGRRQGSTQKAVSSLRCGCNTAVLQSHCLVPAFHLPLLVSCRPSLVIRIRLPARTLSPTALSQDLPFLCLNDRST